MELIMLLVVLTVFIMVVITFGAYKISSTVLINNSFSNKKQDTLNGDDAYNYNSELAAIGQKQTFSILSPKGYKLSCIFLKQIQQFKGDIKVVILVPSLCDKDKVFKNQPSYDIDFINIFFQNGFDVFLYDVEATYRGSPICSMGYYEKDDLKTVTNWVYNFYDNTAVVGTFGMGAGAATAIMHAAKEKRLSFIIADSPFTNLREYLKRKLRADYNITSFPILKISELIIKKRGGFNIKDVSPLQTLKNDEMSTPIFFIYTDEDIYTPPNMLVELYNNKSVGYKKYYYAKNSGHCEGFNKNPQEYRKKIIEFFKETEILKIEEIKKE